MFIASRVPHPHANKEEKKDTARAVILAAENLGGVAGFGLQTSRRFVLRLSHWLGMPAALGQLKSCN